MDNTRTEGNFMFFRNNGNASPQKNNHTLLNGRQVQVINEGARSKNFSFVEDWETCYSFKESIYMLEDAMQKTGRRLLVTYVLTLGGYKEIEGDL